MNASLRRVLIALFALTFVLAACASDTGSEWTFAPVTATEDGSGADTTEPAEPAEETVTQEMAGEADPAEAAEAESEPAAEEPAAEEPAAEEPAAEEPAAAVAGEPRVIMLQADSALRFTDPDGQQVKDIPVTPGETILFQINNTAGFAHNFYIGTDSELSLPSATTDVGIPDWTTGVEELEWVVPEDITDLKFGCTVPGHYTLMQGIFSLVESAPAEEPAAEEPAAEEPAAEEPAAEAAEDPAAAEGTTEEPASAEGQAVEADVRVIPLEADAALRFTQAGEQIREIPVTPGEKVIFRIENTAGFAHNFYIGEDADLSVANGSTDVGIPDWNTGVQNLEWEVPADITGIRFACTVPGHYTLMQGDFVIN